MAPQPNPYPTNPSPPCPCCGQSKCACIGYTCQSDTAERNAYSRPSAVEFGTKPEADVLYAGRNGFYVPPLFSDELADNRLNPQFGQDIGV